MSDTNTNLQPNNTTSKSYKNFFIIASVVSGILFVALTISLFFNFVHLLSANPNNSSLTVSETSSRQVDPNEAKAMLTVIRRASKSDQVNAELDTVTVEVIKILEENGISQDDIETNKNVYQDYYSYNPELPDRSEQTNPSYIGNLNLTIRFRNLERGDTKPNQVIQSLNQISDVQFNGFEYLVENERQICNELESEALQKALEKGKDQVKAVSGKRIIKTTVVSVISCNNMVSPYYREQTLGAINDSQVQSTAPILATKNELSATATVELEYSI
jgi:uncharacterized protein YggE